MNKLQKIIILSMFGLILGGFAVPLFAPNHTLAVEAQIEDDEGSGNSSDNPDEETKPSTSILPSDWKIEIILFTSSSSGATPKSGFIASIAIFIPL